MTRILIIVSSFIFCFFSFCGNKSQRDKKANNEGRGFGQCSLSIFSPYNCYYIIVFDKEGAGSLSAFNKYRKTDNLDADTLIGKCAFKLDSDTDMSKIVKLLDLVKVSDTIRSKTMFDAFRFELLIDNKICLDV